MHSITPTDFDPAIVRENVLRSLSVARVSPFNFPACFLGMHVERADAQTAEVSIRRGLHNVNADGQVNIGAVAVLLDVALGVAMRQHVGSVARMATVSLSIELNGEPIDGDIHAISRYDGPVRGLHYAQGQCSGEFRVGERVVGHARGTFVNPVLPSGVVLKPIPAGRPRRAHDQVLTVSELTPTEAAIYDQANRALRRVASPINRARQRPRSFIEEFWDQRPRVTAVGRTSNTIVHGPHNRNTAGHLQGGVLYGATVSTALALVPAEFVLVGTSLWFISPGGGRLKARSHLLQQTKNIAVVRTEMFGADNKRVLEAITTHARKGTHAGRTTG